MSRIVPSHGPYEMPQKARQHIIPKVFLKSFCDARPPREHPKDVPFTPGVWLLDKNLSQPAHRKAPAKLFVERHTYTLEEDDPSDPIIERWLSRLESAFEHSRRKLIDGVDLDFTEWTELLHFVGVLHARTRDQIELWQRQLTDLERMTRMVERANTGAERYSDVDFAGWNEIGKTSIKDRASGFVAAMLSGSVLLVENPTDVPFVSSDAPVALDRLYPEWLRQHKIFAELIPPGIDENKRAFVAFCALTPRLGLLASPLLGKAGELEHIKTANISVILSLIWFTVTSANKVLIADQERPFPEHVVRGFKDSLHASRRLDHLDSHVTLVNNRASWKIEALDLKHALDGIISSLRFRTTDLASLRQAASADLFIECAFQTAGRMKSGGMRNVRFLQVAIVAEGESVLRQVL